MISTNQNCGRGEDEKLVIIPRFSTAVFHNSATAVEIQWKVPRFNANVARIRIPCTRKPVQKYENDKITPIEDESRMGTVYSVSLDVIMLPS